MGIITPTRTLHTSTPQGVNLVLRPFRTEDASIAYEWFNHEGVYRFMGGRPISDGIKLEDMEARIANTPSEFLRGRFMYAIWTQENDLIGQMQLRVKPTESGKVVMWESSVVGAANFRGMGVGLAAKTVLLEHIFSDPSVKEMQTFVHRDNTASLTFNMRCGAQVVKSSRTFQKLIIKREDFLNTLPHTSNFTGAP